MSDLFTAETDPIVACSILAAQKQVRQSDLRLSEINRIVSDNLCDIWAISIWAEDYLRIGMDSAVLAEIGGLNDFRLAGYRQHREATPGSGHLTVDVKGTEQPDIERWTLEDVTINAEQSFSPMLAATRMLGCAGQVSLLDESESIAAPSLAHLSIEDSTMTSLPRGLEKSERLQTIHIDQCLLRELPENVAALPCLSHLHIRKTLLETLPCVSHVREVCASWNRLRAIPEWLAEAEKRCLRNVNLTGNPLRQIPAGRTEETEWFSEADALGLMDLDISFNFISSVPPWLDRQDVPWVYHLDRETSQPMSTCYRIHN